MEDLLTTRDAARLLGVGTTSIKRWADAGILSCVKTPGGHRRFPREAVLTMLDRADVAEAETYDSGVDGWMDLLVHGTESNSVRRKLLIERKKRGCWWQVCQDMSAVLEEIGNRWESGSLGIIYEHLASERLYRGLTQVASDIEVGKEAKTAVLMTADGEEHTIGLALVEVTLREAGWNTRFAGRTVPLAAMERFLDNESCDLVAVSASAFLKDAMHLYDQSALLAQICARRKIDLALGGQGAWPNPPPYGRRFETFGDLHETFRVGGIGNESKTNGHSNGAHA